MPKFKWRISGAPKNLDRRNQICKPTKSNRRGCLRLSDQLRTMSSPMPSRAPTAAVAGCAAGTPSTRGELMTATTPATVLDTVKAIWEAFLVWTKWRSADRVCWPWVGIDVTGCGCAQFHSIQRRDSACFQAHACKCACVVGLKRVLLVQTGDRDMARPHQAGICRHLPHFRRPVITLARPAAART